MVYEVGKKRLKRWLVREIQGWCATRYLILAAASFVALMMADTPHPHPFMLAK